MKRVLFFLLWLSAVSMVCAKDDHYTRKTHSHFYFSTTMPNDEDKRTFKVKEGWILRLVKYSYHSLSPIIMRNFLSTESSSTEKVQR